MKFLCNRKKVDTKALILASQTMCEAQAVERKTIIATAKCSFACKFRCLLSNFIPALEESSSMISSNFSRTFSYLEKNKVKHFSCFRAPAKRWRCFAPSLTDIHQRLGLAQVMFKNFAWSLQPSSDFLLLWRNRCERFYCKKRFVNGSNLFRVLHLVS